MKDKEWLKDEVARIYDTRDYWSVDDLRDEILDSINELDEPEKVVVPKQEVIIGKEDAKNIVQYKKMGWTLSHLIDDYGEDARHDELLAKAWLAYPDIEVEKEPLYYVLDKNEVPLLIKLVSNSFVRRANTYYTIKETNDSKFYQLTEQEIKDYDERFWTFAVPVEEVEELWNKY